ncbi:hypothetical protein NADE_004677 [Nannochloris sp. 'desiccata']|nr:hypothetical protein NADE_004677 [Chlorella desiccata (nom. nud.)]
MAPICKLFFSSFLQESFDELDIRQRRLLDGHSTDEPFNGNAVDWVLKKVDKSLDNVEENPPAYAKAIYEISTGPVGEAASKGAATAARMTVEVGTQVIKAAAPVGKWVLSQGYKAAVGAVGKGISSALKKKSSKGKQ